MKIFENFAIHTTLNKYKTRVEELKKCVDDYLETTYYLNVFNKRFQCDQCSSFMFTEYALKIHRKKIHEDYVKKTLSIHCDYCDEILDTSKRTKAHYKNFHPNQPIITRYGNMGCGEFKGGA